MNVWDRYRDKRIVYHAGLRAKQYGASGSFTLAQWREVCAQHDYMCAICHAKEPLAADHIFPLAKGGSNEIGNIQPLCKPCNTRKKDKIPAGAPRLDISLSEQLQRYVSHARHRLIIDLDKARMLAILARESNVGVDEFVNSLIEQAWTEALEQEEAS